MLWGFTAKTLAIFALTSNEPRNIGETSRQKTSCLFSGSSLVEQPIERSKYDTLIDWLKNNDAEINDKIELRKSEGCGFGAFVTSDIKEGELLFTVPRRSCLTLADATSDPNCGEAFSNLIEKAGPGGNTVVMAGYMAKEYLITVDELKNGMEPSSRWAPYFQTLPWERGVNNQEHILFWSDDMIESLLKGSLCYGEATSLREEVDLASRVMSSITGKTIRVARGEESGFSWPWESKQATTGTPDGLPEAIKGAFVCLLTRAFQDGEGDEEKLVPMYVIDRVLLVTDTALPIYSKSDIHESRRPLFCQPGWICSNIARLQMFDMLCEKSTGR